ncbi:hypothetical protein EG327_007614 [Venturia inaequalis]|uniref:Uncharacterized protein n=1 Tax=Venturia inaequalis TaxID=5025 RepID=A0A8H3ZBG0_VENIN|nr:hypothetical protein EG327_007614 [Venturia inaequalis]
MALLSQQLPGGIQTLQDHHQIPRDASMPSHDRVHAMTSTSADTTAIPPPKGPTYNPDLAAALDKHIFGKKPLPTTLNTHFFGKEHIPAAEIMTPVDSEENQAYRSRLAQMNQRLASDPAAMASTASTVVNGTAAASAWLPKTAMVKPRKSAIVPRGKHFFGNPMVATHATLEGLGQTVNGEYVNIPGRYQGYGTRIPYASFVDQYVKPIEEVEYENPVSYLTQNDDVLFRDDDAEKEEGEEEENSEVHASY